MKNYFLTALITGYQPTSYMSHPSEFTNNLCVPVLWGCWRLGREKEGGACMGQGTFLIILALSPGPRVLLTLPSISPAGRTLCGEACRWF